MSIVAAGLSQHFGEQVAVNEISFSCTPGTITGFLGPNGAGKSTTMKMLTGYLKPHSGTAEVAGIKVWENLSGAKKKIGYLPESNALYYEMYVREYLAYTAALYHVEDINTAVEAVIRQVGLLAESHKKIGQLSKGYKQRVGLAAAIIHNPEVLILDEPTSGLDPNQIIEIRQVIKSLSSDKTVLLSTHIMQEVEALCNQVIIIHKGNIVANTSLQQLKSERNKQTLMLELETAIPDDSYLLGLPAAVSARQWHEGKTWNIESNDIAALRHQIMEAALQHGWQVASMRSGVSLEEVFQSLTQNDSGELAVGIMPE